MGTVPSRHKPAADSQALSRSPSDTFLYSRPHRFIMTDDDILRPVKEFRSGAIHASIWRYAAADGITERYSVRVARRNEERFPGRYLAVKYETLASRPEETMLRICEFVGEAFAPELLSMGGAPDHSEGNSSFGQIAPGTISTKSVGRYRQVLEPKDIAFIQTYSAGLMTEFDYELEPAENTRDKGSRYWLVDLPSNTAKMVVGSLSGTLKTRWREPIPASRLSNGG